jgi:SHS2 domain-containing protein
MTPGFELVEHTADVGVRAWGDTVEAAFEQAALGMFSLEYEPGDVRAGEERRLEIEAPGAELLLAAWLNELLYIFESEGFAVGGCRVEEVGAERLVAVITGEPGGARRLRARAVVKAATLHDLVVRATDGGWQVRVLLDV